MGVSNPSNWKDLKLRKRLEMLAFTQDEADVVERAVWGVLLQLCMIIRQWGWKGACSPTFPHTTKRETMFFKFVFLLLNRVRDQEPDLYVLFSTDDIELFPKLDLNIENWIRYNYVSKFFKPISVFSFYETCQWFSLQETELELDSTFCPTTTGLI